MYFNGGDAGIYAYRLFSTVDLIMLDTEREKEIGLGPEYPYDALADGECIISSEFSDKVEIGDWVKIQFDMRYLMQALIIHYNENRPAGSAEVKYRPFNSHFDCKVVDFIYEPYGKYPSSYQSDVVLMEFNNFLPYMEGFLPGFYTNNDDFMAYFTEERTLESFASQLMYILPSPRIDYYSSADFGKIKSGVLG